MLVADTYLGSVDEAGIDERVTEADVLHVEIDDTARRRSRFRTTATDGRELGVVVPRTLQDGDVLVAEEHLVVVHLKPVEAMVLDFSDAEVDPAEALEVGHALGNRHWKLVVVDDEVLLPVVENYEVMEAEVATLRESGVALSYAEVSPTTFDGENGDGSNHSHSHAHPVGDDHLHGEAHGHLSPDHDHAAGGR